MEPRKKRKVEPGPPPAPPMSAFALRKQMLEKKEAAARAAQAAVEEAAAPGIAQTEATVAADAPIVQQAVSEEEARSRSQPKKEPGPTEKIATVPTVAALEQRPVTPPTAQAKSNASVRVAQTPRPLVPILRSSFQPNKQNFHQKANGHMLLKLTDGERLVILGSYGLTVKSGAVTLSGATLNASEKTNWVHAPRCYALPVLRCTDDATVLLQPHPAGLSLRQLGKLSPMFTRVWNESFVETSRTGGSSTFQILFTSEDEPLPTRDLTAPPEWNKLISELASPKKRGVKTGQPVLFVCGPKSSGKSTFSRLLTNRMLTKDTWNANKWHVPSVSVLDIDPGQPEFATPGSLSLVQVREPSLSPPFCRPYVAGDEADINKLIRSHELASVSPATDPDHYIESVLDLYSLYRRDLRNSSPLIVNTPGWIQGTGLEILIQLVNTMRPTQVIYMSQEGPEDSVTGLKTTYQNVPLVELPSQPGDLKVRTAAHLRMMQTMSYFHLDTLPATPPEKSASTTQQKRLYLSWQDKPVSAIRPWVVPYAGAHSGILGVVCYDLQPPANLIADAINGTIVSIVAIENMKAFRVDNKTTEELSSTINVDAENDEAAADGDASTTTSISLPPYVRSPEGIPIFLNPDDKKLDPRYSRKLGAALVRGIDSENKELHLLTPLPADESLDEVMRQDCVGVVLVSGKFDLPTWAYTEDMFLQGASRDSKGAVDVAMDDGADNDSEEEEPTSGIGGESATVSSAAYAAMSSSGTAPPANGNLSTYGIPWVETLQGSQKREVGSRVWRVRRDLGRNTSGGGSGGD
ncbi:Polynucleotide 5'-hydroxyl-kinase grc3 [Sporothrix bragantina]|uniref:Polynucleotide 5'-hydroxyl-kinase GRC3 n=1 Tax=Sporothrix bragantina TaxID=671064 RepID=A0ABP0BRV6_9PEZI